MGPIKSFAELGNVLEEEKKDEARAIFERVLKGKFDKVSPGVFECESQEVESIIITPVLPTDGHPSLNITINYVNEEGQAKTVVWSIFEDGTISGKLPKDLKVSHADLGLEILKTIERINFEFWRKIDLDVVPGHDESDRDTTPGESESSTEDGTEESKILLERLEFLRHQVRVLFGFVNSRNGFKGYYGAFFPGFIVLENPLRGNAAYIVDMERVNPGGGASEELSVNHVDDELFRYMIEKYWQPVAEKAKTRGALREVFGAERVVHTSHSWQDRLQKVIDAHSAKHSLDVNRAKVI